MAKEKRAFVVCKVCRARTEVGLIAKCGECGSRYVTCMPAPKNSQIYIDLHRFTTKTGGVMDKRVCATMKAKGSWTPDVCCFCRNRKVCKAKEGKDAKQPA